MARERIVLCGGNRVGGHRGIGRGRRRVRRRLRGRRRLGRRVGRGRVARGVSHRRRRLDAGRRAVVDDGAGEPVAGRGRQRSAHCEQRDEGEGHARAARGPAARDRGRLVRLVAGGGAQRAEPPAPLRLGGGVDPVQPRGGGTAPRVVRRRGETLGRRLGLRRERAPEEREDGAGHEHQHADGPEVRGGEVHRRLRSVGGLDPRRTRNLGELSESVQGLTFTRWRGNARRSPMRGIAQRNSRIDIGMDKRKTRRGHAEKQCTREVLRDHVDRPTELHRVLKDAPHSLVPCPPQARRLACPHPSTEGEVDAEALRSARAPESR